MMWMLTTYYILLCAALLTKTKVIFSGNIILSKTKDFLIFTISNINKLNILNNFRKVNNVCCIYELKFDHVFPKSGDQNRVNCPFRSLESRGIKISYSKYYFNNN